MFASPAGQDSRSGLIGDEAKTQKRLTKANRPSMANATSTLEKRNARASSEPDSNNSVNPTVTKKIKLTISQHIQEFGIGKCIHDLTTSTIVRINSVLSKLRR